MDERNGIPMNRNRLTSNPGPGFTRDRVRYLNMAAAVRSFIYREEFDADSPRVKEAIAKRERRRERNLHLARKGAIALWANTTE